MILRRTTIKLRKPSKTTTIQDRIGLEVLRMYKYFSVEEYPMSFKFEPHCKTLLLTTTGRVYFRKSGKRPTTSPIGSFRFSNKWVYQNTTLENVFEFKKRFLLDGWKVPKGYWEGPPEKRPIKELKEKPLSEFLLKELEDRDKQTDIMREWDSSRTKYKTSQMKQEERAATLDDILLERKSKEESKPVIDGNKKLRAIPNLSESWFWKLSSEEQTALLKVWGYKI